MRARAAAERARRRLADRQANWDFERARAALNRALNRLRAAGADISDLV
ncbi:MAG TPA: ATP synthase delta/epsilon chain alpha-helix domain-containing protein [Thermaerobacter sp.]